MTIISGAPETREFVSPDISTDGQVPSDQALYDAQHPPPRYTRDGSMIEEKLNHILHRLEELERKMSKLDDSITALTTEVANLTTVDASAEALIAGIPALIQTAVNTALAAGATPAQLQALSDLTASLQKNDATLAAAVVASTPAATA
jgi:chromosome segregation ATPase